MTKKLFTSLAAGIITLSAASSAFALGIGAYIDAEGGESYRRVTSKALEDTNGKPVNYGFRAGLIFETCAACENDFSYRLKLGGGLSRADFISEIYYNGFFMSHTFAFAAVKNDYGRFWIGPRIGFSYRRGSSYRYYIGTELPGSAFLMAFSSDFTPTNITQFVGGYKESTRYSLYGIDAGLAMGVNFNLGDLVTLGIEAGVTYNYNLGSQDREIYNFRAIIPYNRYRSDRIVEHGIEGYGSFAFMFRFVDTYQ